MPPEMIQWIMFATKKKTQKQKSHAGLATNHKK